MKRIALILVIILLMSVSFATIGGVILYATGTVSSIDDLTALLSRSEPVTRYVEDNVGGTTLLEQQKSELAGELTRTRRMIEGMQTLKDILSATTDEDKAAGLARAGEWLSNADSQTSADVLKAVDRGLALELLAKVDQGDVTRILDAMEPKTRASLIEAMAKE